MDSILLEFLLRKKKRVKYLHRHKAMSLEEATNLVQIDANDHELGGQRTGEAFHLADVFLDVGVEHDEWKDQLGRFLDVLFSHPYKTPTRDEQAMFMAFAASLRSAQFGRQVGAAITSVEGDILSVGCNEVPKAGGGQYWEGDPGDERDHVKGNDSNDARKNTILDEIMNTLPGKLPQREEIRTAITKTSLFCESPNSAGQYTPKWKQYLRAGVKGFQLSGELSTRRHSMSQLCSAHYWSGNAKVVYIEPYPKSKAKELHEDAIEIGESARTSNPLAIPFVPFVGISPSKYSLLFTAKPMYSQEVSRKLKSGHAINWQRSRTQLRASMVPIPYVEREIRAISSLKKSFKQLPLGLTESQ